MGRKRHIVVDTSGLLPGVVVHPADVQDCDGAWLMLKELSGRFPRLRLIWVDGGYRGALSGSVQERLGRRLEIVSRQAGQRDFAALPQRWVVEQTFGQLGRKRRLSKDYEALPASRCGLGTGCDEPADAAPFGPKPRFLDTIQG